MIATGYPPYLFSENLCNGKLAMALMEAGVDVDSISRVDEGPSYGAEWTEPWNMLKPSAYIIEYKAGNKMQQFVDVLYSGMQMGLNYAPGIRWARRAYEKALDLMISKSYDAVLTRSPGDISHLVGYMLKRKTDCRWIANWNDPADPIWPGPYKHNYSPSKQKRVMNNTSRLLTAADINTFPSDSLRQHFFEYFPQLRAQKTEIIPHVGLIESAWPKGKPRFNDGKLRFLHSGNLSPERNPETTFQALRNLVNEGFTTFEFHIMGRVNEYTTDLIIKYRLEDYVKCIGPLPYIDALAEMQKYDVLVLLEAKLKNGIFFASKLTDYLQSGLPILAISPNNGFSSCLLLNKKGEFFSDNQRVDSIFSSFEMIVSAWKNNTLMKNVSRELFEETMSPDAVVPRLISVIS